MSDHDQYQGEHLPPVILIGGQCHQCGREIRTTRYTLPRKISGDMTFCGFACLDAWCMESARSQEQ